MGIFWSFQGCLSSHDFDYSDISGIFSAWGYLVCDLHCVENPTSNAEVFSHTIISMVCQKIGASAVSLCYLMFTVMDPLCASVPLLHVGNKPVLH